MTEQGMLETPRALQLISSISSFGLVVGGWCPRKSEDNVNILALSFISLESKFREIAYGLVGNHPTSSNLRKLPSQRLKPDKRPSAQLEAQTLILV
jgi:hypothetical protein